MVIPECTLWLEKQFESIMASMKKQWQQPNQINVGELPEAGEIGTKMNARHVQRRKKCFEASPSAWTDRKDYIHGPSLKTNTFDRERRTNLFENATRRHSVLLPRLRQELEKAKERQRASPPRVQAVHAKEIKEKETQIGRLEKTLKKDLLEMGIEACDLPTVTGGIPMETNDTSEDTEKLNRQDVLPNHSRTAEKDEADRQRTSLMDSVRQRINEISNPTLLQGYVHSRETKRWCPFIDLRHHTSIAWSLNRLAILSGNPDLISLIGLNLEDIYSFIVSGHSKQDQNATLSRLVSAVTSLLWRTNSSSRKDVVDLYANDPHCLLLTVEITASHSLDHLGSFLSSLILPVGGACSPENATALFVSLAAILDHFAAGISKEEFVVIANAITDCLRAIADLTSSEITATTQIREEHLDTVDQSFSDPNSLFRSIDCVFRRIPIDNDFSIAFPVYFALLAALPSLLHRKVLSYSCYRRTISCLAENLSCKTFAISPCSAEVDRYAILFLTLLYKYNTGRTPSNMDMTSNDQNRVFSNEVLSGNSVMKLDYLLDQALGCAARHPSSSVIHRLLLDLLRSALELYKSRGWNWILPYFLRQPGTMHEIAYFLFVRGIPEYAREDRNREPITPEFDLFAKQASLLVYRIGMEGREPYMISWQCVFQSIRFRQLIADESSEAKSFATVSNINARKASEHDNWARENITDMCMNDEDLLEYYALAMSVTVQSTDFASNIPTTACEVDLAISKPVLGHGDESLTCFDGRGKSVRPSQGEDVTGHETQAARSPEMVFSDFDRVDRIPLVVCPKRPISPISPVRAHPKSTMSSARARRREPSPSPVRADSTRYRVSSPEQHEEDMSSGERSGDASKSVLNRGIRRSS